MALILYALFNTQYLPEFWMKHKILLFVVLLVHLIVQGQGTKCGLYNCIPGLQAVGYGFDIVKGSTVNLPVMDTSQNGYEPWTNPYNNVTYGVPTKLALLDAPEFTTNTFVFRYEFILQTFLLLKN